jgi:hypothetical protein
LCDRADYGFNRSSTETHRSQALGEITTRQFLIKKSFGQRFHRIDLIFCLSMLITKMIEIQQTQIEQNTAQSSGG